MVTLTARQGPTRVSSRVDHVVQQVQEWKMRVRRYGGINSKFFTNNSKAMPGRTHADKKEPAFQIKHELWGGKHSKIIEADSHSALWTKSATAQLSDAPEDIWPDFYAVWGVLGVLLPSTIGTEENEIVNIQYLQSEILSKLTKADQEASWL